MSTSKIKLKYKLEILRIIFHFYNIYIYNSLRLQKKIMEEGG
nr:MAG TPA: hypothetical protein [Caudoviricetes sp.]